MYLEHCIPALGFIAWLSHPDEKMLSWESHNVRQSAQEGKKGNMDCIHMTLVISTTREIIMDQSEVKELYMLYRHSI